MPPGPSTNGAAAARLGPLVRAAAALPLAVGCASLDARVSNLHQLHQEDGKVSYWADLMGDTEFFLRDAFTVEGPLGFDLSLQRAELDEDFVPDPSTECLEILLSLDRFDLDDRRNLALRTEIYAWLLHGDAFVLSRERSAIELGPIARRLGVTSTLELDPAASPPDAETLSPRLVALVQASTPILAGRAGEAERAALADACAALSELDLDVPSGRRVLRTAAALLGSSAAERAAFAPVRELTDEVARFLTAVALTRGLEDPAPVVRAAVLEAWTIATDNRAGHLLVEALGEGSTEVRHQVCRLVARYGIPASGEPLQPAEAQAWEDTWLLNLVRLASETLDGQVSAAACAALATASGGELETLRFEEWALWFEERMAATTPEPGSSG